MYSTMLTNSTFAETLPNHAGHVEGIFLMVRGKLLRETELICQFTDSYLRVRRLSAGKGRRKQKLLNLYTDEAKTTINVTDHANHKVIHHGFS